MVVARQPSLHGVAGVAVHAALMARTADVCSGLSYDPCAGFDEQWAARFGREGVVRSASNNGGGRNGWSAARSTTMTCHKTLGFIMMNKGVPHLSSRPSQKRRRLNGQDGTGAGAGEDGGHRERPTRVRDAGEEPLNDNRPTKQRKVSTTGEAIMMEAAGGMGNEQFNALLQDMISSSTSTNSETSINRKVMVRTSSVFGMTSLRGRTPEQIGRERVMRVVDLCYKCEDSRPNGHVQHTYIAASLRACAKMIAGDEAWSAYSNEFAMMLGWTNEKAMKSLALTLARKCGKSYATAILLRAIALSCPGGLCDIFANGQLGSSLLLEKVVELCRT